MPIIQDKEFGKITIVNSPKATQIKIKVSPNGTLRVSMPPHTPILLLKYLLKSSRSKIRLIFDQAKPEYTYKNGMQIGKSHTLISQSTNNQYFSITKHGQQIIAKLPNGKQLNDPEFSRQIRDAIISALRLEAKKYLPKRLLFLANKYGYTYSKVRFSHASSRWGSCSSSGTISLNIALMKLPFELIDYIIIHELSHTKQMNHSQAFWKLVEQADPNYKSHRKLLKLQNPSI
ncbi:MAG: hypothetical protein PWQ10_327 [Patescibacteria group bacterium]|nr:hypothetical protein [Patescibacteria group bacterium]